MSQWHPDNGSDLDWFENPIYREIFFKAATAKDLSDLALEFASGNWSAFGVWARAVLSGRLEPKLPDVPSPHASFWNTFLQQASEPQRKEVLNYLLNAQMAQRSIKERPQRCPPPGLTPTVRKAILDYLSVFKEPKHTAGTDALLGPRLLRYSHLPDERLIHLAGLLGMAEAIPYLAILLKLERRLFQLYTDYCTSPEEIDSVYEEAVRALVNIGLTCPSERPKVHALLKAHLADEKKSSKSRKGESTGEMCRLEIYNDGGRASGPSRHVSVSELAEGGPILSKATYLSSGLSALDSGGKNMGALQERYERYPQFSWTIKATEGPGVIDDEWLYYIGSALIQSVHLPTGRTGFMAYIGQTNSNNGVACYYPQVVLGRCGELIVICQVISLGSDDTRSWRAITLDRTSGEVIRSFDLAVQPTRAYGPQVWPQSDGSLVMRLERNIWCQARDGKVQWAHEIDEQATVRCEGDMLGVLTKERMTLNKASTFEQILDIPVATILEQLPGTDTKELRDDLVLNEKGFYLFPRFEGPILAYDMQGAIRWKGMPPAGGYYLNHPRSMGLGLCGDVYENICWATYEGELKCAKRPDNIRDTYLSTDHLVIIQTDMAIFSLDISKATIDKLVDDFPSISQLVALSDDFLVVNFYDKERYLACLPRSKW